MPILPDHILAFFTRRRGALFAYAFIPGLCLAIGGFTDGIQGVLKPTLGIRYLLCSTIIPMIASIAAAFGVNRLRERFKDERSLKITIDCFLMGSLFSFLTPEASEATPFSFTCSCFFMGRAWVVESSIGIQNKLGLISGCTSLTLSFVRSMCTAKTYWYAFPCLILIVESITFSVIEELYGSVIFADEDDIAEAAITDISKEYKRKRARALKLFKKTKKNYREGNNYMRKVKEMRDEMARSVDEMEVVVADFLALQQRANLHLLQSNATAAEVETTLLPTEDEVMISSFKEYHESIRKRFERMDGQDFH